MYCPKCSSRLYPDDEKFMQATGVCGSCVGWDDTPDKRYKKAWAEATRPPKRRKGNDYVVFEYVRNGVEYLTDRGFNTANIGQAKFFTLKQARELADTINKEVGQRRMFIQKVEG